MFEGRFERSPDRMQQMLRMYSGISILARQTPSMSGVQSATLDIDVCLLSDPENLMHPLFVTIGEQRSINSIPQWYSGFEAALGTG